MNISEIYREYGDYVFKYSLSLCHDADDARDLTQETFYQAIRSVHKWDGTCKVTTWLCQITKHLWYQELERRSKKQTVPLAEDCRQPGDDPADTYILQEEKMELFRLIHTLNETEKEVVFLRLTGEMSFAEIGDVLGKSENWARVTFYRAKQKLRKKYLDGFD